MLPLPPPTVSPLCVDLGSRSLCLIGQVAAAFPGASTVAMAHPSVPPGETGLSQCERDQREAYFRLGEAAAMLFQAKEATDAILVEYRLPAPPPAHGDAALAALQRSQHRRDVLIRLGGAVVVRALAQETMDSLLEVQLKMWTPRRARTRSPRSTSLRRLPRSPLPSASAPPAAPDGDKRDCAGAVPPRARSARWARHGPARASRTRSPRLSSSRVRPQALRCAAKGIAGMTGAASSPAPATAEVVHTVPGFPQPLPHTRLRRAQRAHRGRRGVTAAAPLPAPERQGQ